MNNDGKNAVVSEIHDRNTENLGLVTGLRIVRVQGTNVEGLPHEQILDKIKSQTKRPLFITFKKVKFIYIYL